MKLKPLSDRVIIKPIAGEEATKSGIILPDTVDKEKPEKGEVISVGPGKRLDNGTIVPIAVAVGQKVVFKKYSPDEIKIDRVEYLIVREEDLMAVIE